MSKYQIGPLRANLIQQHDVGPFQRANIQDINTGNFVAQMYGGRPDTSWDSNTVNATALVFAAAPELLEALEAALPYLIRLGDFIGNEEGEAPMGRCEAIGRAKDAIAKATKGE